MIPIRKRMGVLLMVFPAISPLAAQTNEEPAPPILMQDYTSKITINRFNHLTLKQRIGSPYGAASRLSGDAFFYQGLFGLLYGDIKDTPTGVEGITVSDNAAISLAYDGVLKTLDIKLPETSREAKLFVVDMNGKSVLAQPLTEASTTVDISTFAPGVYMAGVAINNNYSKTLKFIVK